MFYSTEISSVGHFKVFVPANHLNGND